jgi:uncharacterized membrane protein (DUF4010 family)
MNRECSFTSLVFEGTVNSAVVVASINHFITTLQLPTSLVIDNASIHTRSEFLERVLKVCLVKPLQHQIDHGDVNESFARFR